MSSGRPRRLDVQRLVRAHARPRQRPRLLPLETPGKAGMSSETLLFDLSWQENGSERTGRFVGRLPPPADTFPLFPD